jgi:Fe-S oxidoreductase
MAKLKYAFQSEYYRNHPRQLRDYVFGYFHLTAAVASSVAPLSNALMRIPAIKNLIAGVLGVTPHRPFPDFVGTSRRSLSLGDSLGGKRIIFLSDAFARYLEPEIENAALDLLIRCGFEVHVLPVLGAGASFLSKGFIEQARRHASHVLDLLSQADPGCEAPIVGIEPPEIYTLKHDYLDLLPERSEEIGRRVTTVWLLDEFLLRSDEFNAVRVARLERQLNPAGNSLSRSVHFHPHCHQRAEGPSADGLPTGTESTVALLRSCGYNVELLDTGCCGMAGTFGYEAEHYELSMKVGELRLFPRIREWQNETREHPVQESAPGYRQSEIVATGAACRLQIRHGTGAESSHPILLVTEFLRG